VERGHDVVRGGIRWLLERYARDGES
jgi:hypothetical protein